MNAGIGAPGGADDSHRKTSTKLIRSDSTPCRGPASAITIHTKLYTTANITISRRTPASV